MPFGIKELVNDKYFVHTFEISCIFHVYLPIRLFKFWDSL